MKKLKKILAACLITVLATGCVKYNAIMDINKDKSMDFTIIYALDKSMMGEMSSLKEEDFDDLKKDGYSIEKYSEGNFEGFKITKKIKSLDEVSTDKDVEFNLSGMMEEDENNKYMFKVVKNGDKETYYAKFKFDSNDSNLNEDEEDIEDIEDEEDLPDDVDMLDEDIDENIDEDYPEAGDAAAPAQEEDATSDAKSLDDIDLSGMMGNMDLSFTVNLPSSAISSNATSKENNDKKLTWKLNYSGTQSIEFAFEIDPNAGNGNLMLYLGIGAGVLVLVGVCVAVVLSKKKKAVVAPTNVEAPVQEELPQASVDNKE